MNEFTNYQSTFTWVNESREVDGMGTTVVYKGQHDCGAPMKAILRYYNDTSTKNTDVLCSIFVAADKNAISDTDWKLICHDMGYIVSQNYLTEFSSKKQYPPEIHTVIHFVDKIPDIDTWFTIYCTDSE